MYRSLDFNRVITTIGKLQARITERFPDSGLSKVCGDLYDLSKESKARCTWISTPLAGLRIGVGILVGAVVFLLSLTFFDLDIHLKSSEVGDIVQLLEAGMNGTVMIGAAIFFLITVESRIKRKRALKAIYELRVLTHVIDIHQLTKDPEQILSKMEDTVSSPKRTMSSFELRRYLDYCSEMLSLVGKVAAFYAQGFQDPVVLSSVNDVENLTTGLSRKIWQKIMTLHFFERRVQDRPKLDV